MTQRERALRKAPPKRSQHVNTPYRNIVGRDMFAVQAQKECKYVTLRLCFVIRKGVCQKPLLQNLSIVVSRSRYFLC